MMNDAGLGQASIIRNFLRRVIVSKSLTTIKRLGRCGAILAAAMLTGSWLVLPAPDPGGFAVSPTILDNRGHLYHARLSADEEWLLPVPLSAMGPWLPKVAVAIEDRRFGSHPGVDFLALARAMAQNLTHGRVVSGASTITVQTVRLTTPRPRTLLSKYVEFIQALKLERGHAKDEILEIYLNRAPFGGNLRGAEAAARFYFDKSAADLSLGESTLLVALLRGPSLYRPDRHPEVARQRRDGLLDLLVERGVVTAAEAAQAKAEPIAGRQGQLPRRAWHLAESIFKETPPDTWRWTSGRYGLKTTLDRRLQELLELRLNQGLADRPGRITGAGAIMDNRTGAILAYVGNARRTERQSGHWVDCADAPRSPGSALKPFIYLTAFAEKGLTPASLLADTPLRLSGQAPRNFDEYYRGPVSAQNALAESLNAPAVRVLRLVGPDRALVVLRAAGFDYARRPGSYYGDSLALGGCEVSLRQLLGAYGTLARQGLRVTPSWRPGTAVGEPQQIFSAGAAWLTNECLKDDARLPAELRLGWRQAGLGDLAFKTGTSHGLRDAWLAAYTPEYTVVLWLGDPTGAPQGDLVGLRALGPVLVPLMRHLYDGRSIRWPDHPPEVAAYDACPVSGQPVGPYCPSSQLAWRLAAGAQSHPCRLHALQGGQVVSLWPPELAGFMAGRPAAGREAIRGPVITSPLPGGVIMLSAEGGYLPLRCEGTRGLVHWFVDDEFYEAAGIGRTPILPLKPGRHRVSLIDAQSRRAAVDFTVKYAREADRDRQVPVLTFE